MQAASIFYPVGVLALWTLAMVLLVGVRRVFEVRVGRLPISAFALGESREVPANVSLVNRNYMNLLEAPVLFYVAAISLYVTENVTPLAVLLAWVYVGLRLLHSAVHVAWNRVAVRAAIFAVSNFVLVAIWITFLTHVH